MVVGLTALAIGGALVFLGALVLLRLLWLKRKTFVGGDLSPLAVFYLWPLMCALFGLGGLIAVIGGIALLFTR